SAPRLAPRRVTVTPLHSTVMGRPCRGATGSCMSVLLWTCPRNLRTLLLRRLGSPLWSSTNREHIGLDCAKQRLRLPERITYLEHSVWGDAVGLQHASPPPLGIGAPPGCEERAKVRQPD